MKCTCNFFVTCQCEVVSLFLLDPSLLQIVFSILFLSFLSFSILSILPFSTLSLLPLLISPSLSAIPSSSSDQFFVFLRYKDFNFHSVSLLSQVPLACGCSALPSPSFIIVLQSNLTNLNSAVPRFIIFV